MNNNIENPKCPNCKASNEVRRVANPANGFGYYCNGCSEGFEVAVPITDANPAPMSPIVMKWMCPKCHSTDTTAIIDTPMKQAMQKGERKCNDCGAYFVPKDDGYVITQQDIVQVREGVEIVIRDDGRTVWVNVDGVCALRVGNIPKLVVQDKRVKQVDFSTIERSVVKGTQTGRMPRGSKKGLCIVFPFLFALSFASCSSDPTTIDVPRATTIKADSVFITPIACEAFSECGRPALRSR